MLGNRAGIKIAPWCVLTLNAKEASTKVRLDLGFLIEQNTILFSLHCGSCQTVTGLFQWLPLTRHAGSLFHRTEG